MLTLHPLGDDAYEVSLPPGVSRGRLAERLRRLDLFVDVVPGLDKLAVSFDPLSTDRRRLERALVNALKDLPLEEEEHGPPLVLPVRYGGEEGPDLEAVAASGGMETAAFIACHTARSYPVALMGFTPGFAYLTGLDERIECTRLATPRVRVAAGSVGVIAGHTGIYSLDGPGGWPIVGRVLEDLFSPKATDPFTLALGQTVRFEAA
ncbi:hypothetical protein PB2503_04712 [Parvularcula bermudensis HTCC2503]|uniref:Carboxyltransferase domain-containing protein n=1 Tax=Parvularcula bermudensis (strain ATCC BAA-594 / HTCC2503 / KCTC 12087) TaxID=314260 RepID=E0TF99_PARBH|nr:allophanate hydrolase subunit 1 [Parvularcula bermudensis]ADM09017.1 hypothetical protein PB2503_04712 [Parvularcula bermudensis HTCC2503]